MNILYVITGLGVGGAEKVVINLAEQMYQNGHTIKIVYLKGEALLQPQYKEIELIPLKLNSLKDIFGSFIVYRKLLTDFQPDVVHSHMVHANIFVRLNRLFKSIPRLICTAHNSNEGGFLRMLAYRLTHYLADVTTNVSQEATQSFLKKKAVRNNEIMTIYNGIDLNKFSALKLDDIHFSRRKISNDYCKDKKILLAVGRLNKQKDYPNLIKAVALLKQKFKLLHFQLWVVGEGEEREQIEKMIQILGLDTDVKLLGMRHDIPKLMTIADIFVLSSKFEGLPTVLIEAMACKKFVVATDCGGSAEILGDTGMLVEPQNSLALAQAIETSLKLSDEEICENGKRARQRVEDLFALETIANQWLKLYESKE